MVSNFIDLDLEELIKKVKNKKRVLVHSYFRKNPLTNVPSLVTKHYRYVDVNGEKIKTVSFKDVDTEDEEDKSVEEQLDFTDELDDVDMQTEEDETVEGPDENYEDDEPDEKELSAIEKNILESIDTRDDAELIKAWQKDRDETAIATLLTKYDSIIRFTANKFKTTPIPYNLILLKAKAMAVKAADTYKLDKKAAFNTHLTNYLKKVNRFVNDNQNIAKIPEQRIRKINLFKLISAQLEDKLKRPPTDAELADELSWSIKEVQRLKNELGRAEILNFGDDYSYGDLGIVQDKAHIAVRIVYFDANPDERYILENTTEFFGKKPKPIKYIAEDLHMQPAKVKKILSELNQKIIELI